MKPRQKLLRVGVQWNCMKKLQIVYHGHKPEISAIVDENGDA